MARTRSIKITIQPGPLPCCAQPFAVCRTGFEKWRQPKPAKGREIGAAGPGPPSQSPRGSAKVHLRLGPERSPPTITVEGRAGRRDGPGKGRPGRFVEQEACREHRRRPTLTLRGRLRGHRRKTRRSLMAPAPAGGVSTISSGSIRPRGLPVMLRGVCPWPGLAAGEPRPAPWRPTTAACLQKQQAPAAAGFLAGGDVSAAVLIRQRIDRFTSAVPAASAVITPLGTAASAKHEAAGCDRRKKIPNALGGEWWRGGLHRGLPAIAGQLGQAGKGGLRAAEVSPWPAPPWSASLAKMF